MFIENLMALIQVSISLWNVFLIEMFHSVHPMKFHGSSAKFHRTEEEQNIILEVDIWRILYYYKSAKNEHRFAWRKIWRKKISIRIL